MLNCNQASGLNYFPIPTKFVAFLRLGSEYKTIGEELSPIIYRFKQKQRVLHIILYNSQKMEVLNLIQAYGLHVESLI